MGSHIYIEKATIQDAAISLGNVLQVEDSLGNTIFSVNPSTNIMVVNDTVQGTNGLTAGQLNLSGGDASDLKEAGGDLYLSGGAAGLFGTQGNIIVDQRNMGIHVTNPAVALEVQGGRTAPSPWLGGFPVSVVAMFWNQSASICSIGINANTAAFGISSVLFGDPDNLGAGSIQYRHQFDEMQFYVNASITPSFTIDSSGDSIFAGTVTPGTYTVATLPAVGTGGATIFVSDESGGPVNAYSDGTNWRRVSDGAVVS